jgi:hypothetical protein
MMPVEVHLLPFSRSCASHSFAAAPEQQLYLRKITLRARQKKYVTVTTMRIRREYIEKQCSAQAEACELLHANGWHIGELDSLSSLTHRADPMRVE